MADSKLSTDTGAQNLMDLIGCQISGTLHVDKKRFKFIKDRSTRLLILSNRVPRRNICGLYCFGSIYAPTAEFAYSTLELQNAKSYEPSDKKGLGLLIMFEKADKSPLKFICAGRKESEEWVEKINAAINEDKKFSQDSAYGSGGSFIGERFRRTSATGFDDNQQKVPNYDDINEETMVQTNKYKDAEYAHRKEPIISEQRNSSREGKQTSIEELQDITTNYENPEEQHYLNENLGKQNQDSDNTHRKERINSREARQVATAGLQDETILYETYEDCCSNDNVGNPKYDSDHTHRKKSFTSEKRIASREIRHTAMAEMQNETSCYENSEKQSCSDDKMRKQKYGVPETGTNVLSQSQSFNTSDITTQGNVTQIRLAKEALAKVESRRARNQKIQDVQGTTSSKKSPPAVMIKPSSKRHRQQTITYSAKDQDESYVSIREGSSVCSSMSYLSVASGESDAVPITSNPSVRRSGGDEIDEEALYVNTPPIYQNNDRTSKLGDELSSRNPVHSSDKD